MKNLFPILLCVSFIIFCGDVIACGGGLDDTKKLGKKIYTTAFGRGCNSCHDVPTNPQLPQLIKDGKLDKNTFFKILKEGKNGMPKALDAIMEVGSVKRLIADNCRLYEEVISEEVIIDSLYSYLNPNDTTTSSFFCSGK